jgi:hypothetical protein
MQERVARAPKLFGRAAVILDFGGLSKIPDVATAKALLDGLRRAGVLPVALAYGTTETDLLSQQLGLPLQGGRCRSALGGASGNEQCRERTPQRAGVGVVATTWHMRVQA